MSGTTFTWTSSGANDTNWNLAANWTPTGGPPNSTTVAALDTIAIQSIISGGSSDSVSSLVVSGPTAQVVVGGGTSIGGDGLGTLTSAGTITVSTPFIGGGLVGGGTGTINAPEIDMGAGAIAGGGGTFNVADIVNAGTIQADGGDFGLGALHLTGSVTGGGSIEITGTSGSSQLQLGGATAENVNITTAPSFDASFLLDDPTGFTGHLDFTNFGTTNTATDLFFKGETITGGTFVPGGTGVVGTLDVLGTGGATLNAIPIVNVSTILNFNAVTSTQPGYGELAITPVCFARGTRMATPAGERAIEDLKAGDTVLVAGGEQRRVVWIGRRRVDCARHPDPEKILPVRIKAGAFGKALPKRDLLVSPQHAIFDEGVLIPAAQLINGSTVTQEKVASIEYFHIELEHHDVVLAEGLPAESYLDSGDRATFENGGGALVLHPDFSRWAWDARACAEIKVVGPEVEAVRLKLARRARAPAPRRRSSRSAARAA